MNRRHLLRVGSAALAGAAVGGRLFAAPVSGPRLLIVFCGAATIRPIC